MEKKIHIATVGASYNHRKNFLGLNLDKVRFSRAYDFVTPYRFLMRFSSLKKWIGSMKIRHLYFHSGFSNPHAFHFFNTLAFSSKPWITTFELSLPRWGNELSGFKLMTHKSCYKLVAISESARNVQLKMVERYCPQYLDNITAKLTVIHPYQKKNIQSWAEKNITLNEPIRFGLVGNDFFRKGGLEVLKVMDELIREGLTMELIIVSNLRINDYASKATESMKIEAETLIEKLKKHIIWHQNIPNTRVFELMKSCHVGLLPTYADTYGYSLLEFQSLACPVITTNINALPEINNNERGWMIEVPRDEFGEAYYRTEEERKVLSDCIFTSLKVIMTDILNTPNQIEEKGTKALNGLDILNNPEKNAARYFEIYQDILKNS